MSMANATVYEDVVVPEECRAVIVFYNPESRRTKEFRRPFQMERIMYYDCPE